jgi:hypothetical protein
VARFGAFVVAIGIGLLYIVAEVAQRSHGAVSCGTLRPSRMTHPRLPVLRSGGAAMRRNKPQGVGRLLSCAWALVAACALLLMPSVGPGTVSFCLVLACVAAALVTAGLLAWGTRTAFQKSPTALIAAVMACSWFVAVVGMSTLPAGLFASIDRGFGISTTGERNQLAFWGAQVGVGLLMVGLALFGKRLESGKVFKSAEDDIAQRMHDALVPEVDTKVGPIQIWGRSRPCENTGGDFIEVFEDGDEVTVIVGDVSGHGVGAGIVMAMIKGALRVRLQQDTPLDRLMSDLNELVLSLQRPGVFVTATCVKVHISGKVQCASAGHLPIIRLDPFCPRPSEIPNECLPLGVESEERYIMREHMMTRGETLALLTDGLVEVQDRSGNQIGMPLIRKVLGSRLDAPLPEIFEALANRCEAFGKQVDDQTLVLIRFGDLPEKLQPLPTPMDDAEEAAGMKR